MAVAADVDADPGATAAAPLPWLAAPLAQALSTHRGHALLVHAPAGLGAQDYALALARGWLCESAGGCARPCGACTSCRLVDGHAHPDLMVVMPASLRRASGWLMAGDRPDADDAKRKPSRQIRIDEVRSMIDWSQMTSARGRGKVAVLHPAEALNRQSANALLKTLEEPPDGTRLVLTCADPALLLPTVVSRCQVQRLAVPDADTALAWLRGQGVSDDGQARVLLAACSGRPLDAVELLRSGVDAPAWSALPFAVARGQAAALGGWPLPRVVDALMKLCHDALACAGGAGPRYFEKLPRLDPAALPALAAWSHELARVARHDEHPWNEPLLVDAVVAQGAAALSPPAPAPGASERDSRSGGKSGEGGASRFATLPT